MVIGEHGEERKFKNEISLASWLSVNAFVSGAEDLRFKSQAGQIEHIVANGLPLLHHFFKICVTREQ